PRRLLRPGHRAGRRYGARRPGHRLGAQRRDAGELLKARLTLIAALALVGCNLDPSDQLEEQVGYRTPEDGLTTSGERGNVVISEILWSGSVTDDGTWDPADVFVEIRNQGNLPVNLSGWRLEL